MRWWLIRGSSCSFVLSQVAPSRNMEVSGTWDGLVSSVLTTPVFPYLWLPHVIIMTFFLRSSLGPSAVPWAQRHPFSCFTLGLVYCFSGGLVGLFLSNKSLLTILTWSPNLYSFSIAWYLMFFSPYDVVYRLISSLTPVLPLMVAAQDWLRIAVVASGIRSTLEEHPTTFVYPVVFAVVTSNGFLIFKYFEQVRTEFFPIQRTSISVGSKHLALPPCLCHPSPLHQDDRLCFYLARGSSPWSPSCEWGAAVRWPRVGCHPSQACHHLFG